MRTKLANRIRMVEEDREICPIHLRPILDRIIVGLNVYAAIYDTDLKAVCVVTTVAFTHGRTILDKLKIGRSLLSTELSVLANGVAKMAVQELSHFEVSVDEFGPTMFNIIFSKGTFLWVHTRKNETISHLFGVCREGNGFIIFDTQGNPSMGEDYGGLTIDRFSAQNLQRWILYQHQVKSRLEFFRFS